MFNKDFYPTPKEVIDIMLDGLNVFEKYILEPSAGSGNIIKSLHELGAIVSACEKDKDLSIISRELCDQWIKEDFLEVQSEEVSHIDFIIMNPPFSADEKHILHAWEIAPNGCVIKALCNWETVENPYNRNRRSLVKTINEFGNSVNLGDCFSTAERKTGIEVGLVSLYKPASGDNEFDGYFDMSEEYERAEDKGLVKHNEIKEIVNRYVGAVKMFYNVEEISSQINKLAKPFNRNSDIRFGAYDCRGSNYTSITREVYKKDLQKAAWKTVFQRMKMEKYVTKSLMEKLNAFVEKQVNIPFKMSNIFKMIDIIYQTYEQNMDKAIIDLFDKLTMHTHDNRHYVEGWKSNSQYLVSKKFIMPWMIGFGYDGKIELKYANGNGYLVDDLTKSMCFLTGQNFDNIGDIWSRFHGNDKPTEFGTWYDWGFFEFKGYKKGTAHFKFKNESDWVALNQRIGKIKGWTLPEKI